MMLLTCCELAFVLGEDISQMHMPEPYTSTHLYIVARLSRSGLMPWAVDLVFRFAQVID